MDGEKLSSWLLILATFTLMAYFLTRRLAPPSPAELIFWIGLLLTADLLPVSLGFKTQVTMSFPIMIAVAIHFHAQPAIAMVIAGLGSFDIREIRREIPMWHALFNRAQLMLAVAAAAMVISFMGGGPLIGPFAPGRQWPFVFPLGAVAITLGAVVYFVMNLGLVGIWVNRFRGIPLRTALASMPPRPIGGFVVSQAMLAALGAATAAAYQNIGFFVAAFLIPLLFARLSILGARAQQDLGERIRKQQKALLEATEKVFQERENERKRIAEDIHDSSLQMLAAAAYGCGNTAAFIDAGRVDSAHEAVTSAREAIDDAIKGLRESLVDLRRSSVEEGGLVETIRNYSQQVATLWGAEVRIQGRVASEPPIPVALAAFQILQEGLVNALKHSDGSTVVVKISDMDNMVHIVVEDEGPGFNPDTEVGEDHVGMRLMEERAARVGGRIELESQPGSGTRLEAILPGGVTT
ncbi:MAG: sensor histidine kinase [Actinomycetota bacterium]